MKLGLIGCGRMGKALALGAIDAGAVPPADLLAYDVFPTALDDLVNERQVTPATSIAEVAGLADVLLLCTKPHDVPAALHAIAASGTTRENLLVISVAAGLTIAALEHEVGHHARVIRSMPNTPALIGKGAAAFTRGSHATPEDVETAHRL
ncbi:MAG: NAD(P)-binding domain-containing protein, partial [Akkermansiaceae bacterium]|nr:NAD(P)-binding domain-containing protein [Akkermansiaceae bacterium]